MAKKTSSFLLRKSSKKKYNFYEEYKILGSTFNYSSYFKQNLLFDYWLRYKLNKLNINLIDVSYFKSFKSLNINILINKKYLLTNKELFFLSYKKSKFLGFTTQKFFIFLRWLKNINNIFFFKRKKKLRYYYIFKKLKKYYFCNFFKKLGNNYYFFFKYLEFLKKKIIFKLLYLNYFFKIIKTKKINNLNFYISLIYLKNNINIIFFFLKNFNINIDNININIINIYNFKKDKKLLFNNLKKINYFRWYSLKLYLNKIIFKIFKNYIHIFILNFNDFKFLSNEKKLNFKNIYYFKEVGLLQIYTKNLYNCKFFLNCYKNFFYNNNKINNKNYYFIYNNNFYYLNFILYFKNYLIQYFIIYFLNFFFKIFYNIFFNIYKVKYYYRNLNYFYNIKKNIFWNDNLKKFYIDLKKNCIFFTVKEVAFKKLVISFFFSLILEKPLIFCKVLSLYLSKTRKHHYFLNNIEDLITIGYTFLSKYKKNGIKSITIKINGKFNGTLKRSKRYIFVGEKLKLQNIDYNIKYSFSEAFTFAGVFGIKVWYSF